MRFISSPSDSGKDRAATPAPTCRLKPAIATRVALPQPRPQAVAGLAERAGGPTDPLVPTTTGTHLSRDAIERRLARHLTTAAQTCPSLKTKHITMHTLRHSAAMRPLLASNDPTVIALWLGHEQISTTQIYLQYATRRPAVSPAQPGGTQGKVLGSNG
jgi:integrase/recombinase XerD